MSLSKAKSNHMNTEIEPTELIKPNWPNLATRTQWAKILGLNVYKLQYEERMYRLTPTRSGFNVYYTKDEIISWLRMTGRI
jgi:hypothetical protein